MACGWSAARAGEIWSRRDSHGAFLVRVLGFDGLDQNRRGRPYISVRYEWPNGAIVRTRAADFDALYELHTAANGGVLAKFRKEG